MEDFDLQPNLRGDLIELRPLSDGDFEELYLAASDPLIWQQHPLPDRYKEPIFRSFFAEALESRGAFVAIDSKTQKIIGSSRYYELDTARSQVVIGYTFLKRDYWGGVYNREMKRLMLEHAFKYVAIVQFHVDETNLRSQKAMAKIGGRQVGQFQKPKPGGGTRTALIYAISR
jgi:N-acetyltransferase